MRTSSLAAKRTRILPWAAGATMMPAGDVLPGDMLQFSREMVITVTTSAPAANGQVRVVTFEVGIPYRETTQVDGVLLRQLTYDRTHYMEMERSEHIAVAARTAFETPRGMVRMATKDEWEAARREAAQMVREWR